MLENEWNKWKNHFSEMKGDVGMSLHAKEREQEDAHSREKVVQPHPLLVYSGLHTSCISVQMLSRKNNE